MLTAGDADASVAEIVTDSRVVQPGDLFVALEGPRFDAHEFVGEVLAKGAAAIVHRGFAAEAGAGLPGHPDEVGTGAAESVGAGLQTRARAEGPVNALIEVSDTLQALQDLAHAIRQATKTRLVAITGSAGKTTTKETIAAFLGTRLRVVKNKGNLNNHVGLPLSLMQLRTEPDVAVMELGMNHAGEISTLVAIAEPDVRVWTNVGDAHIGFFASPDAIADAKAEILEGAGAGDVLVCNADDARVMARASRFAGRVVTFGSAPAATVRAREIEDLGVGGMRARIATPAGERLITTPLLGRGNLSNVLAATAVALEFGVGLDHIADAAARLQPADRRGTVRRLRGGVTLIDDSYNSSPSALKRSLEVLGHQRAGGRHVAVLGEMLELGGHARALHEECGRAAVAAGVDLLFVVGGDAARALANAADAAGMPRTAVRYFETSAAAAAAVGDALTDGDVVLVKGSRGIRMDVVADRIVAERG
ncbi:MAG TPA: UDP-N-acetylmuramoyl-tripeptide--D-alanyl-D-alanine ligase [Vicinamibacterales bacterium]|jgi:UDP-N-acetylmuramoyl-tripeptide--D-alanyl-D-alanine ligase|nr:UDP-N-acetylmuramoyl-tripeptide--D-alanyl-D-alanine ligase [Vicinamibacterales bacterium]